MLMNANAERKGYIVQVHEREVDKERKKNVQGIICREQMLEEDHGKTKGIQVLEQACVRACLHA